MHTLFIIMSSAQLAKRLGVSQQAISKLSKNEVEGNITINSLKRVAAAMGCELQYFLVPRNGSLKKIIHTQALKKAEIYAVELNKTMSLEGQAVNISPKKRLLKIVQVRF